MFAMDKNRVQIYTVFPDVTSTVFTSPRSKMWNWSILDLSESQKIVVQFCSKLYLSVRFLLGMMMADWGQILV